MLTLLALLWFFIALTVISIAVGILWFDSFFALGAKLVDILFGDTP